VKRRDIIVLSALLTLVGSVYFSTLAVNHCEAEDSLRYLKTISTGSVQEQFHPHHLLYHIVNFSLYHGIHALGVEASVEATAQSLNAAFGLLGLAVLFALMTRLGLSWFLRVISLLFLASSYGYWWYSVECEVYIMPLPFILLAFYMIAGMYTAFSSRLNHVLLAIFFALAVLFHQQHALLLGPILAGYGFTAMTKRDEIPAKTILARLVLFGCLSALFVAAPYLYVIFLIHELSSVAEITHWVLDYAASGMDEGWSITGLLKGILFAPRVIFGAHFVFCFNGVQRVLARALPSKALGEEFFLVSGLSKALVATLCSLTIGFVSSLSAVLVAAFRNRAQLQHHMRSMPEAARCFCFSGGTFVLIYAAFNVWWEPQNIEFWIAPYLIAIAILSVIVAPLGQTRWVRYTLLFGVGCLFAANLLGSVLLQQDHEKDYWYTFNRYAIEALRADDLVVSGVTKKGASYISDGYVDFYSQAETFLIGKHIRECPEDAETAALRDALRIRIAESNPRRLLFIMPHETGLTDAVGAAFLEDYLTDTAVIHRDDYQTVYHYTGRLNSD
jgi:hypothetical protein